MRVTAGFLVVLCGLSLAPGCSGGSGDQNDSGPGGSGNDSGNDSGRSGEQSGASQSGGSGGVTGGTAGAATGGAAGAPAWPDWVDFCAGMRAQLCAVCYQPECVMCVYGSDEEIAETGVVCDDTEENYRRYCSCTTSGSTCPLCRDEWYP